MKTVPFSPEKVNVWLQPVIPTHGPGITNERGSQRRRPPAPLLDHPDRLYKHQRGVLSPPPPAPSPAGVKPGSLEA